MPFCKGIYRISPAETVSSAFIGTETLQYFRLIWKQKIRNQNSGTNWTVVIRLDFDEVQIIGPCPVSALDWLIQAGSGRAGPDWAERTGTTEPVDWQTW